jgi:hypothetical protein
MTSSARLLVQHLERDNAIELFVAGAIDDAHAPLAELLLDRVMSQLAADHPWPRDS